MMQATDGALFADFQGLTRLRAQARQDTAGSERAVAQQFESLFVQMMLKAMRDAVPEGGLLGSDQMKFHQQMFDQQLSLQLSRGGGIGLADRMLQQLSTAQATTAAGGPLQSTWRRLGPSMPVSMPPMPVNAAEKPSASHDEFAPASPEDFIRQLWPHARRAAAELRVEPEVLVAQAALESGWGQHVIQRSGGGSSYNLFGIKADGGWSGERVAVNTLEYRDGVAVREQAHFRAYHSLRQTFDDYVDFLRGQPRYLAALDSNVRGRDFIHQLQAAGYATDPNYADKVGRILNQDDFGAVVLRMTGDR